MYEIIKGRPMPGRDKYGMRTMGIGDSFDFPEAERAAVNAAIQYAKSKTGFSYSIRFVSEGILGCWRVEKSDDQDD